MANDFRCIERIAATDCFGMHCLQIGSDNANWLTLCPESDQLWVRSIATCFTQQNFLSQ